MDKYLEGYLSSIPQSEYENIIDFLKRYAKENIGMTEEKFEAILEEIVHRREPSTQNSDIYKDERPKDTYNRFFGTMSIDLIYLFKIINSLYKSSESYSQLSSSYFSDIKYELDKLNLRVEELKAKNIYDQNTIVVSENFKTTENMEDYNQDTSHLFKDRFGQNLPPVSVVHNNTDDMLQLPISNKEDLLYNENGKAKAKIKVLDYRGVPDDNYALPIEAIDYSDNTYWDLTTKSKRPIDIPMDNLESGGAYTKFKIILSKISRISEISITPYGPYPLEVSSVKINDIDVVDTMENPINSSTETITFNFEPIVADEIIVVIRQRNYTYDLHIENEKVKEAERLWNMVSEENIQSYYNPYDTKYTDNHVFKEYISQKKKEMDIWNTNIIKGD